jgi:outer membrane protein assembly factor BamD
MKRILLSGFLVILALLSWQCAGTVNTAAMNDKERFEYALKIYKDGEFETAMKEFEAILLQFPGSEIVDDAQFYLGQCHFNRKEYLLGAYEFSKLIKNMASSSFVPEAQYMLASCYYQLSPGYPLDQKYTKKAIEEFQAFVDFFPADKRVPEAEAKMKELYLKLAEKEFHNAYIYERMEYYTAAILEYGKVTETYHDTKFAPMASYKKIQLLVMKNKRPEALQEISSFLSRYPNDEHYAEIKDLKATLESNKPVAKG